MAVLAIPAALLVLNALRDSIVFFSTPSMAAEKHIPAWQAVPAGRDGAPGVGRPRRSSRRDIRCHRRQYRRFPSPIEAFCRTCFAKDRAWWQRARSMPVVCSGPIPCLPGHDETHAEGRGRCAEEAGPLERRLRRQNFDNKASDNKAGEKTVMHQEATQ